MSETWNQIGWNWWIGVTWCDLHISSYIYIVIISHHRWAYFPSSFILCSCSKIWKVRPPLPTPREHWENPQEVGINSSDKSDLKFKEQLENEIQMMKDLKHPRIVTYFGHDYMDDSWIGRADVFPCIINVWRWFSQTIQTKKSMWENLVEDGLFFGELREQNPRIASTSI